MDKETKKRINKIREKYKDNKDVDFLLLELSNLELKLIGADVMAMMIDITIKRDRLDPRSLIADARIDYGMPWKYEFVERDFLLSNYGEIPEVKDRL